MTAARSRWLRRAAGAVLAASAFAPGAVLAQAPAPAGDSMAMAEALFRQARDLFKQGQYAEACPKLAESQRLDPKLGTLLNLAVCNEKLGKVASAWAEYASAAAIARREGQKEREDFARDQVAALEARLTRIVIQVGAPAGGAPTPGLHLTWDDQPLDGAVLGTPFPVDPGKHKLAVTAPGRKAWYGIIDVSSKPGQYPVPIPALEVEAAPAPAPSPVPVVAPPLPPAGPAPAPPAPPPSGEGGKVLATIGFSVAAAGVIVGAVGGGIALKRASDLHTACGASNLCNPDEKGAIGAATAAANASNVGFAFAAAGLGVGVAGLLVLRPRAPEAPGAAALTPIVGPGFAGLRGSF